MAQVNLTGPDSIGSTLTVRYEMYHSQRNEVRKMEVDYASENTFIHYWKKRTGVMCTVQSRSRDTISLVLWHLMIEGKRII